MAMMNDGNGVLTLVAMLFTGGLLGVIFFGGLWWTVQRGTLSPAPVRWFFASLILRTAIVLTGFYLVGATQPVRLGVCMLGFVLARVIVMRVTRSRTGPIVPPASGVPPCA